jgi:nitrate/TMAO reductase-like tetraheme cytochrome c subunit
MFSSSLNGLAARTVHPSVRAVGVKFTCEDFPTPDIIAAEIIEDLEAALEQIREIVGEPEESPTNGLLQNEH